MGRYPRRANFSLVCQDGLEVPFTNKEVLIIFGKGQIWTPNGENALSFSAFSIFSFASPTIWLQVPEFRMPVRL